MYFWIVYMTLVILFFIIRYEVDIRAYTFISDKIADKRAESDVEIADSGSYNSDFIDEYSFSKRDYDNYDERIEMLRREIEQHNNAPSDAYESPGVYNIPHDEIKIDIDLEPAIEEEEEIGLQEIAK